MAKVSFGSGGGGGASTGVPIGGAVANTVLFSDASSNLGSVAGFNFLQTMTQSSGTHSVFEVARTTNQTSTAGWDGIRVNINEAGSSTGERNLLNCLYGGAKTFRVSGAGEVATSQGSFVSIYNTASETTNIERFRAYWSSNIFNLEAERTGTGVQRQIRLRTSDGIYVGLNTLGASAGHVEFLCSSTALANAVGIGSTFTSTASSTVINHLQLSFTANQSGTAGYNVLNVSATETSTGSGTKNLIVANVGGAHRFSVRNDGTIWIGPGSSVSTFTPSSTTPKLLCQAQVITGGQIGFQWSGNFASEMTPSSGIATYMTIRPNITTSSTGGYTVLQVTGSDGGAGTGAKNILSIGANAEFQISNLGVVQYTPSAVQTLAAANPIVVNRSYLRVQGSGGAVTITATPTIAAGIDGQVIYIVGQSNTNTITVQDRGTLASSNLRLGATTRTLGAGDILKLMYDGTFWSEVSFINNL